MAQRSRFSFCFTVFAEARSRRLCRKVRSEASGGALGSLPHEHSDRGAHFRGEVVQFLQQHGTGTCPSSYALNPKPETLNPEPRRSKDHGQVNLPTSLEGRKVPQILVKDPALFSLFRGFGRFGPQTLNPKPEAQREPPSPKRCTWAVLARGGRQTGARSEGALSFGTFLTHPKP